MGLSIADKDSACLRRFVTIEHVNLPLTHTPVIFDIDATRCS